VTAQLGWRLASHTDNFFKSFLTKKNFLIGFLNEKQKTFVARQAIAG
jgi:hypothetical protein